MSKNVWTVCMFLAAISAACFAGSGIAEEKATKEEAAAKCREAAAMVKEKGLEATVALLNDKKGPFVWKDSYVFCIDFETGNCIAHPFLPNAIGKDMRRNKDKEGRLYVIEFINTAKTKGEGWVSYMWPKAGEQQPLPKITCVYRVPDQNIMMLAGVYE
ncbi:MAG: cache domain-containing protein [Desulfobacterales bacterium]